MCSEKFRVNANKRRVDVWLIYRCATCEETWNATLHERTRPEALGDRLDLYHRNSSELAWQHAFDHAQLTALGARLETIAATDYDIVRSAADSSRAREVVIAMAWPLRVRLDRLLARGLDVSRSEVARLEREGLLRRSDGRGLSKLARDGARIRVERSLCQLPRATRK